jgi:hypothetical protein
LKYAKFADIRTYLSGARDVWFKEKRNSLKTLGNECRQATTLRMNDDQRRRAVDERVNNFLQTAA